MNNLEAQADIYSKKYPHYRTYAQCQSKAFMMGMFAMIAGTSGGYIAQELMRNKLWYGRKSFFLTSIVFGSCAGYLTVSRQTKVCQDMWMALEEKHTSLQPISERTSAADSSDNT